MSAADRITVGNIRIDGARHVYEIDREETGNGERYEYFFNIIRRLVRDHGLGGRRWFITYDGAFDIPELGEDCVVFMYGEERSLTPWRYEKAGLVLKAYGMRPNAVERFRPDLPWLLDRTRIERNRLQNLTIARRMGQVRHQALAAKTLPIPLGYGSQEELAIRPFDERANLVWFAGSLHNATVGRFSIYARLANVPKLHARQQMVAALEKMRADHPDWPVALQVNATYQDSKASSAGSYARRIMDAKICVVPRGTTPETHRLFEAMRAGCVVIAQALPDVWFYRSAPVVYLERWDELERVVLDLQATPGRLERFHRASRNWWEEVAGPAALSEVVGAILTGRTTVADVMRYPDPKLSVAVKSLK